MSVYNGAGNSKKSLENGDINNQININRAENMVGLFTLELLYDEMCIFRFGIVKLSESEEK